MPPQEIVVALTGAELAVDGLLFKFDDPGARDWGYRYSPAAFPDGWTANGTDLVPIPWRPLDYRPRPRFELPFGVRDAFARSPAMIVYVFQQAAVLRHPEADPPGHDGLPSHFGATVKTLRSNEEYISVAGFDLPGAEGGGAIGYDAKIALYTTEGRFIVLNFANSDQGSKDVDVSLDVRPSSLSITSAGYALLSGANGVNGPANHLQVLDDKGAVKWAVTLGFLAEQPAIDAGGGRLYLVGGGFAAVEDGKVLWSSVSSERVSAMAFSDGGLAMTVGTELRVLDRDGHVLARLRAPDGEILGRPAIGPDGAIWVASKTTLYVAR